MTIDVGNFYLNTPMTRYEYMRIPVAEIPQEIIDEYKLLPLVHKGYVYVEIRQGMYGLPQAGKIANDLLAKRLAKHGYFECRHTPGLWRHIHRPITFTLVVDDFGVQYTRKTDANHLLKTLQRYYPKTSTDWDGTLYCGVSLDWDYTNQTVDISMPNYVKTALAELKWDPRRKQDQPHPAKPIQYGAPVQLTNEPDVTAILDTIQNKFLRQVIRLGTTCCIPIDCAEVVASNTLVLK